MKPLTQNNFFTKFEQSIAYHALPTQFSLMQNNDPHPLCVLAAEELQNHILNQKEWQHNFGLDTNGEGTVIGKMFGVLVVQNNKKEIGYLAAFSGKLAGSNQHAKFVPPIFDLLTENSFLNKGMQELTSINLEIKKLSELGSDANQKQIAKLKAKRKQHSIALQNKIFDQYYFLNQAGEEKSLVDLFLAANYKNPPAGAGECAGPKLLQYAFQHQMKPLAIAEFWWGLSPKSATWKHKQFYPCCKEKCEPILAHMLK
ncbi:pseudouridylate synthase [Pedobacter polaris]|uniref:Pseudouridylate synthase n=1 Tax=Pedobacter polaris TaxID=2571273 RepID=A0A4U1CFS7_9SPHI|nr:pseudouridylate synthase [Pedobacter polaris]TKC05489.1 pseudouridylate synthase [Pedobacter polaris]